MHNRIHRQGQRRASDPIAHSRDLRCRRIDNAYLIHIDDLPGPQVISGAVHA